MQLSSKSHHHQNDQNHDHRSMQLSISDQNHDHDNFSTKLKHFNKVIITYQIRTRRMSLNQKIHETLDFCHKQYSSPHQLDHNPSSQHLLLHSNIDLRRRRQILRRKRFSPSGIPVKKPRFQNNHRTSLLASDCYSDLVSP